MFNIFLLSYLAWVAKLWLKLLWIICQKPLHYHHHHQHFVHHQETMNKFSAKCVWGKFKFFSYNWNYLENLEHAWRRMEGRWIIGDLIWICCWRRRRRRRNNFESVAEEEEFRKKKKKKNSRRRRRNSFESVAEEEEFKKKKKKKKWCWGWKTSTVCNLESQKTNTLWAWKRRIHTQELDDGERKAGRLAGRQAGRQEDGRTDGQDSGVCKDWAWPQNKLLLLFLLLLLAAVVNKPPDWREVPGHRARITDSFSTSVYMVKVAGVHCPKLQVKKT